MKRVFLLCLLLATAVTNSIAQDKPKDVLAQWQVSVNQLLGVADAMPADKYSFKATPEQADFGTHLRHATMAMRFLIGIANGKEPTAQQLNLESAKTKDAMIAALKNAAAEWETVISKMDEKWMTGVVESKAFGKTTRRYIFLQAITHNNNHYGQLVVYLRLNGVTPPEVKR